MARETQSVKIDRLEKEVELWRGLCEDRNKEIEAMQNKADEGFLNSPTYIQMTKRMRLLEEKAATLENTIKHDRKMNELTKKNKHNERGAGRKSRLSDQEKETIRMYRIQGKTIKELAEIFQCSVGLVHKLITE